jgi:hypothetical protein
MLAATRVLLRTENMHRLTARLLLLLALVGNLAPLALAASTTPAHACCLRNASHHCHDSATEQPTFSDRSCCRPDCARALTITLTAYAQPTAFTSIAIFSERYSISDQIDFPAAENFALLSTRAPPQFLA